MIRAHEFRRFQLELQLHDGSCTAVLRKKRTPVTVTRLVRLLPACMFTQCLLLVLITLPVQVQWACLLLLPLWNLLQRASLVRAN